MSPGCLSCQLYSLSCRQLQQLDLATKGRHADTFRKPSQRPGLRSTRKHQFLPTPLPLHILDQLEQATLPIHNNSTRTSPSSSLHVAHHRGMAVLWLQAECTGGKACQPRVLPGKVQLGRPRASSFRVVGRDAGPHSRALWAGEGIEQIGQAAGGWGGPWGT